MKIATLIVCYNRKDKTVACLKKLFDASKKASAKISNTVFLTDDGSIDGTKELVEKLFPTVNILLGNGNLFWAGGMRNSWAEALKQSFDGYLLLNDDTILFENIFDEIFAANLYSYSKFGKGGIYVGSTTNFDQKSLTYGGSIYVNKFLNTIMPLQPTSEYQDCHLGNANITYVSIDVVDSIGILRKGYVHGIADYDYTYSAFKKGLPVFILKGYQGICENDHQADGYFKFNTLSLKDRIDFLYSPRGLQFKESLLFQKRFFPYRYVIVFVTAWFKVLFPNIYSLLNKVRN